MGPSPEPRRQVSRRTAVQALVAGTLAATGGCVGRTRSVVTRAPTEQLSLSIATVPADVDRESVMIARQLSEHLEAVGIDASIELLAAEELPRQVMLNHDFDIVVTYHPGDRDPDVLYQTFHSSFASEAGWQNPFGFTNLAVDELLEAQRKRDGADRQKVVAELLRTLADEQPIVPLCRPHERRLVRTDRFEGWDRHSLWGPLGYLDLGSLAGDTTLRGTTTNPRPTETLNPLSVEPRTREPFGDLLYDSLAIDDGGELRPWLAEGWDWESDESQSTVTLTLRPDLTWHDGTVLTADDVAFTYRFLEDTSLGENEPSVPAPRFRSHTQAIEEIDVRDDRTLRCEVQTGREATVRAFTVPILPEHIWRERASPVRVPGVIADASTTEAIVTDNIPPIGSGPFAFREHDERNRLVLERFPDHFSLDDEDLPEATVEQFTTTVAPRSASAIELVESGAVDVTTSTLEAYALDTISESPDVQLLDSPSSLFYYVGFNTRQNPLGNPYFRRIVARLLDKAALTETIFEGDAEPTATLLPSEWVPTDLVWEEGDPVVPFFGANGDLDTAAARAAFERAGFSYDDGGRLLVRG